MIVPAFGLIASFSSVSTGQEQNTASVEGVESVEPEQRQRTQDFENDVFGHSIAVEVQGAPLGGPLGMLGAGVNYSPIRYLSLEAGVGQGGFGPQWGLAARPKLVLAEDFALNLTVGYSRGDYKALRIGGADGAFLFSDASWVNTDVGFEWRSPWNILIRPFFGVSKLIASSTPVWHESGQIVIPEPSYAQYHREPRLPTLVYLGLALGVYFSI